jgi:hypothetical protein
MSGYQQYFNEYRTAEYQQNRMREASVERSLMAMRREQDTNQPAAGILRISVARLAWHSLATHLASFL